MKTRSSLFMTGITLDLFTVILLVALAFTWGFNGGRNVGKMEVQKSIDKVMKGLSDAVKADAEKTETRKKELAKSWNELMKSFSEAKNKEEDQDNHE